MPGASVFRGVSEREASCGQAEGAGREAQQGLLQRPPPDAKLLLVGRKRAERRCIAHRRLHEGCIKGAQQRWHHLPPRQCCGAAQASTAGCPQSQRAVKGAARRGERVEGCLARFFSWRCGQRVCCRTRQQARCRAGRHVGKAQQPRCLPAQAALSSSHAGVPGILRCLQRLRQGAPAAAAAAARAATWLHLVGWLARRQRGKAQQRFRCPARCRHQAWRADQGRHVVQPRACLHPRQQHRASGARQFAPAHHARADAVAAAATAAGCCGWRRGRHLSCQLAEQRQAAGAAQLLHHTLHIRWWRCITWLSGCCSNILG